MVRPRLRLIDAVTRRARSWYGSYAYRVVLALVLAASRVGLLSAAKAYPL